jgi:flagellar biosynthesis protein FlhF
VRADDLTTALARVRAAYGENALVLGTRKVMVRDAGDLAPRAQIEIVVQGDDVPVSKPALRGYDAPEVAPSPALKKDVGERMTRLQEIASRVESMAGKVEGLAHEPAVYPLAESLRRTGATARTVRQLSASFEMAVRGGEASPTAARRHLSRTIRATRAVEIGQMRGEHWFFGRAGSGKTTLVLHLAGSLIREDLRCGVISVQPPHVGDIERMRSAERALGIELRIVSDARDLIAAREDLADCDVVLVDTPCHVGHPIDLEPDDLAQSHLVVPLGDDRDMVRQQLRQAPTLRPDCLAVSQMDLFPRPGRIVDLAAELQVPVSFLTGRQEGHIEVRLARGERLLQVVLDEPDEEPALAAAAQG